MKKYLALFLFCLAVLSAKKTVYIVEIGGIDTAKYFYDYTYYRDEVSKPFVLMREAIEKAGYDIQFTQNGSNIDPNQFAALLSFSDANPELLQNIARVPRNKCLLFIHEPPVVLPQLYSRRLMTNFGKIFSMFDDMSGYRKLHFAMPRLEVDDPVPSFHEKKFCLLINGNKDFGHLKSLYPERRKAVEFFTSKGEFDLYGPDWEGYSAWRGTVPAKWPLLKQYKFCICYENMRDQLGYITEKIFDCLVGGCVPIYWGASNIGDYIPKECFIDKREFPTYEELYKFMKSMDKGTYEEYLAAARQYFASGKAHRFSSEYFAEMIVNEIKGVSFYNR